MTQPELPLECVATQSCPNCGVPFVPMVDWHRFCSARCRTAEYDKRRPRLALDGQLAKERGMAQAVANNPQHFAQLVELAEEIARAHGTVDSDMLTSEVAYRRLKIPKGPFWGGVFKGKQWEWTGQRVKSIQKKNHARELKVWRLKG